MPLWAIDDLMRFGAHGVFETLCAPFFCWGGVTCRQLEYPDSVNLSNYAYKVAETPNGYLLFGRIQRPDYYDDAFIRSVDKQGNTLWFHYYTYSAYTQVLPDLKKINDSLYVGGIGTHMDEDGLVNKVSFLYINLAGNTVKEWSSALNPSMGNFVSLIPLADNGLIVYGQSRVDIINGTAIIQSTLTRVDSTFEQVWTNRFGIIRSVVSSVVLWDFLPTIDGNFIGAGETGSKVGSSSIRRVGWLYKFSPEGDSLWERLIDPPFPIDKNTGGLFSGLGILSSGSIVAGGQIRKADTSFCWVVKVSNEGCLDTLFCQTTDVAPEPVMEDAAWVLYPNPAVSGGAVQVTSRAPLRRIRVYDFEGREVAAVFRNPDRLLLPAGLAAGVYGVWAEDAVGRRGWKKLVVR